MFNLFKFIVFIFFENLIIFDLDCLLILSSLSLLFLDYLVTTGIPVNEAWIWHGIPETIEFEDEFRYSALKRDNMKISIILYGQGETVARCEDTVGFLFTCFWFLFSLINIFVLLFLIIYVSFNIFFSLICCCFIFQVLCYLFFPPLESPFMNLYDLHQDRFEVEFKIGAGHASNRFDMGIEGMKVGSKRIIWLFR